MPLSASDIKRAYAEDLFTRGDRERADIHLKKGPLEPLYAPFTFHHEEEYPKEEINRLLEDMSIDILALDTHLKSIAENYQSLIRSIKERLGVVEELCLEEKERLLDMRKCAMISPWVKDSIPLTKPTGTGQSLGEGIYIGRIVKTDAPTLEILSITGNGYEGNHHVYHESVPLSELIDTSIRSALTDKDPYTYYEYSRLVAPREKKEHLLTDANRDEEDARCVITLRADTPFTMLTIKAKDAPILVESLEYSLDNGITFSHLLRRTVPTDSGSSTDEKHLIRSQDIFLLPPTTDVRLTLSSSYLSPSAIKKQEGDSLVTLTDTHRKVIAISDIAIGAFTFESATLTFNATLPERVDSIALYSDHIIPKGFSEDSLRYELHLDGNVVPIVPINSHENGTKVYRLPRALESHYAKTAPSAAKSVTITAYIKAAGESTPVIKSLALLIGKGGAYAPIS